MQSTLRRIAAVPLLTLVAWLARAATDRAPSIEVSPSNPTAGQTVHVRDVSSDAVDDVFWTFGDGQSSATAASAHTWDRPGTYAVELTAFGTTARIPVSSPPPTRCA